MAALSHTIVLCYRTVRLPIHFETPEALDDGKSGNR